MKHHPLKLVLLLCLCTGLLHAASSKTDPLAPARELDALLAQDWANNKVEPNPPATDEVFVRRVYLDVVGRIPTVREAEEFLGAQSANKRAELIDRLLASDGYAQHFFNYWADVLRLQSFGAIGAVPGAAYTEFIKESLRTNKPYDQFVRELIASKGRPWENPAIGYYMRDNRMPLDNFANTARIFLGTRIECAQCHNHPFDKWTQMQFYQMTAFTYANEPRAYTNPAISGMQALNQQMRVDLGRRFPAKETAASPELAAQHAAELEHLKFVSQSVNDVQVLSMGGVGVVYDDKRKLELPHDYQYPDAAPKTEVQARTMMGGPAEPRPGESSTEAYARWMTSPENPRFTTVIANRLWKMAFGLALIEPLDEMSEVNTPSNPELMRRLETLVRESGYDMKACLRVIFNTRAYQAAATKQEVPVGATYHFTGPVLRRMSAEQMWDSFVTLINAAPLVPSKTVADNLHARITKAAKIIDAIDLLTPEEAFQGAKVAAESYRAAAQAANEARFKIEEAKARKDTQAVETLVKQTSEVQAGGRRALGRSVFLPAVERLAEIKEGRPAPPSPFSDAPVHVTEADLMALKDADPTMVAQRVPVKGYDKKELTPEQEQAEAAREEQALLETADYFKIPAANRKSFIAICRNQRIYWARAADMIQPAFRGTYLRIFGQSDRELIENSSRDASVPQALTLMNSDLLLAVMSRDSQLMLAINRQADSEAKLEAAYLALLSRKPTERERTAWHNAQADGLDSMEDLVYALVNTTRFLFIE
ncbi:MAG TPA: DUF1549 domain-containing protein [Chthoniobacteraceae bacterium]|nr:DUF1549 domain-containing protein [Chthoniobacteraceae bacterium]